MKRKSKLLGLLALISVMLVNLLWLPAPGAAASGGDEYDALRQKLYDVLTGGATFSTTDPDIAPRLAAINDTAQQDWDTMNKEANRTCLWGATCDALGPDMKSNVVSGFYNQLKDMALAYATRGTELYQDADLLADIISGMDWMYANYYNLSVPVRGYDNWYYWQISAPLAINNVIALLYSHLTAAQIADWEEVVAYQTLPFTSSNTGANRVWTCNIMIAGGILTKDGDRIAAGVGGLSPVLAYVDSGEGFYEDGSFLQHTGLFAYNGGYGISLIDNLTQVMYLVAGSSWDIADPNLGNVYDWIYSAYEPLFYDDNMMAMVTGRNIDRIGNDDLGLSSMGALGSAVVRLAYSAPDPADVARYKSMVKQWMNEASSPTPYATLGSIQIVQQTKDIMADASVAARGELLLNKQYPGMARAVHRRPGWAFGVSMSSDRISNYESISGENVRGWHTGDGMTYLYNADRSQYMDAFWPTVDSHRLPGTTVIQGSEPAYSQKNGSDWVGGTDMDGLYGATGMRLVAPDSSLSAYKSWFMFDDEVVNLGAGIQSTDASHPAETIVENRKLNASGDNTFTVDGTAQPAALNGGEETLSGVSWAHLAGNEPGSDIGYYFPETANLKSLREARTDQWSSINQYYTSSDYYEDHTRNYLTLWVDHGAAQTGGTYDYVLLPNKTAAQSAAYAASPDIAVLENSAQAQAVKENTLGLTAINFWQDAAKTIDGITSDKKASVMVKTDGDGTEVSVSDPTMANDGTIELTLDRAVGPLAYADEGVSVETDGALTRIVANVAGSGGAVLKARFLAPGEPSSGPDAPTGLAAGGSTEHSVQVSWNAVPGASGYRLYRAASASGPYVSLKGLLPGATSFTDMNLAGGTSYFYQVAAWNESGMSEAAGPLTVWTVPQAPEGLSLEDVGSSGEVTLGWQPAAGASGYLLYRAVAKDGTYQQLGSGPIAGLSYTDETAQSGVNYYYEVASVNDGGVSQPSAPIPSLFGIPAYAFRESFDALNAGDVNGQNGWVGNVGGVANEVAVQPKDGAAGDQWLHLETKVSGGTAEAYKLFDAPAGSIVTVEDTISADDYWKNALIVLDSGLSSGNVGVNIVMAYGEIWGYNGGTKTTLLDNVEPDTPYRLKAVIDTATKKFDVYVNGQLLGSQWSYRNSAANNLDKLFVGNSANLHTYMNVDDVKVSFMPSTPAGLQASGDSSDSIRLSWNAASGAAEYRVYRSEDPAGGFERISAAGFNGLTYVDDSLPHGQRFYYKVAAANQGAVSAESGIVTASTAESGTVNPIDENFDAMNAGAVNGQNGWVGNVGGVANEVAVRPKDGGAPGDQWLHLETKVSGGTAEAYKLFNAPAGSIVTVEDTISADDYWKNALIVLDSGLSSGNVGVNIVMAYGEIWGYNGGTKTTLLDNVEPDTPYRLKAVIDTATKKFDVYVNGLLLGSQWSYRNSAANNLDKLFVGNSANLHTYMNVDDVKVSYTVPTPETTASLSPEEPDGENDWYVQPVVASLNAKSARSAVARTEYSLDSGTTWGTYESPLTFDEDGSYTLLYRSSDEAGSVEPTRSLSFRLDMSGPAIDVSVPDDQRYFDDEELVPLMTASDEGAGEDPERTYLTIDGRTVQPGESLSLYTLPLGVHSLQVTAYDKAGNQATLIRSFTTTASLDSITALIARFAEEGSIDNGGVANSLTKKLENGNVNGFINEVQAQRGKHIEAEEADYLLRDGSSLL